MYELLKNRLRLLGYGQILFLAVFCVAGLIAVWLGVQQGVRVFYADQQDTFENETSEISARANQHIVFAEDILHSINAYLAASEDVSGAELERFISQLHRGSQFNDVRATYFIPSRIVQDDQHSIVQDQESLIFSSHGESQVDDVLSQLETPELSRAIEEVLRRNEDRAAVHRDGEEILVHILSPAISDGQVIGVVGSKVSLTVFAQENLENRSFGYVIASDDPGGDRNVLLARSAEEGGFVSRIFRLFGIGLWQKTTSFRTADVTWELAFIEDPVSSNSVALQAILLSLISVAWASVFLLTGIFMLLMTNEAHAQRRADELTTQLREHQKNLAFHSSILHALNEGVIAANIEGGIIYWDKRMEEMFGYDSEEVKGEKVFILADTEAGVRQNAEQIFAQLKAGETWSGEFPMRRKNGEQFYGFISASPMRDVDGKEVAGVVATIYDVTHEHELEAREERLLKILDTTPDFVGSADPDGNVIFMNKGALKMRGIDTPPETVGDNHSPEVREKLESEAFPEAVKEGYWRGESAIKGPGGEDIPVDQIIMAHYNESGEVAWFSTIARDISHRKEVEEKLKDQTVELAEGKAQDEAILRSLGEGLLVTNAEGDITFVNGAFEDLLGWDQSEVIGRKVSDVVPMRTENGVLVPFEEQILTHILSKSEERVIAEEVYYFFRKNGKQFPVAITVTPIILDGEPIGAVEVFRDITREREIDKAKTEFVSLASHQLRTPLSTINWYAEMLLSGDAGEITPQQQKFLDQVHTSSQRMVQLVNGLLNVSRIEMGNLAVDPEPTDLRELARSVLKEQQLQIKDRNLSHKEEFAEDVPKITLDASLMHIVFQNLISNAVKYTPEGGQFGVVIHRVSAGDEIEGTRIKKDSVLAVVWDHGYGIPDRQKDQIFSKLFRADNIKEKDTTGTGLGLYIVKAVVDGADGQIWFASTEGKGTSFFVAIPLEGMERREGTKGLILSDY